MKCPNCGSNKYERTDISICNQTIYECSKCKHRAWESSYTHRDLMTQEEFNSKIEQGKRMMDEFRFNVFVSRIGKYY